jgi:hypothetical protein
MPLKCLGNSYYCCPDAVFLFLDQIRKKSPLIFSDASNSGNQQFKLFPVCNRHILHMWLFCVNQDSIVVHDALEDITQVQGKFNLW